MAVDQSDPYFDWSTVFELGDVIVLPDGRVGVIRDIQDCSEDSRPPCWEMYVVYETQPGQVDSGFFNCADGCEPATDEASRAEADRLRNLLDLLPGRSHDSPGN